MFSKNSPDRAMGGLSVALAVAVGVTVAAIAPLFDSGKAFAVLLQEIAIGQGTYDAGTAFAVVAGVISMVLGAAVYVRMHNDAPLASLVSAFGFVAFGGAMLAASVGALSLGSLAVSLMTAGSLEEATTIAITAAPMALIAENGLYVAFTAALPVGLAGMGVALAASQLLPRVVAYLAVAAALVMPFYWVSSSVGIVGGAVALMWFLVAGSWMVLRGLRVSVERGAKAVAV
jgi:hypothetical protein